MPNADQLDGAAKDWYPLGRWVDVSDAKRGVTLVPLDAPLVHLGGITTGKWDRTLHPEGPTIMTWALNNHWLVNFKSSQSGQHPAALPADDARGPVDPAAAARFAAEVDRTARRAARHRADRRAQRHLFRVDPKRPCWSPPSRARTRAGWRCACRTSRRHGNADRHVHQGAERGAACRSDRAPRRGTRAFGAELAVELAPLAVSTVLVKFAP